jgi:hypothetical protein
MHFEYVGHVPSNGRSRVNVELKRLWNEAAVAYFKIQPQHLLGKLRIACLRAEIETRNFVNTKQECQISYRDVWYVDVKFHVDP